MLKRTFDANICVMTRIFETVGGKWKPIILYLIQHEVNRFGIMKRSMPKISKKVLTNQLRELEAVGLISRHVYVARAPQVIEYHLTSSGVEIRQLIDHMVHWGLAHFRVDHPEEYQGGCRE
jgi:DNA-binding HxlR family transcriptional regulator